MYTYMFQTYWSDWAFDYYLLWANPADHPNAISRAIVNILRLYLFIYIYICYVEENFTSNKKNNL